MPSPATTPIAFHGTSDEAADLITAIIHNCDCQYGFMGMRTSTCGPHQALASEQRFMDGMLFARRLTARWQAGEFSTEARS